jgi:mannose-6-phosphate isomerase-like protein (cupin superfamily)
MSGSGIGGGNLEMEDGQMNLAPIDLAEKLSAFAEHWSPKVIARLNDYEIKVVKVQGEFVWHAHDETDELFLVVEGELTIQFRDGDVTLRAGQLFVLPRGVKHCPIAGGEAHRTRRGCQHRRHWRGAHRRVRRVSGIAANPGSRSPTGTYQTHRRKWAVRSGPASRRTGPTWCPGNVGRIRTVDATRS